MVDLKNYVCVYPFQNLQIHKDENWVCCPHWLPKSVSNSSTLVETWNNDDIKDIRKTIMDGSYKHCSDKECPFLAQLINFGGTNSGPIIPKNKISKSIANSYNMNTGELTIGPVNVQLNFDMTCNYKCPSCRTEMIVSDTSEQKVIRKKLDEMEESFSNSIETLYTSTVGDPFASVPIRTFLRNFNKSKYPKLKNIHLHTNGSLWNSTMWDSMPNIQKYVRSCEISIDAGTKETYETKTRLGGNWDVLIENLKFISKIKSLIDIKLSFVVQANNYMEMKPFLDLVKSIFGNRKTVSIFFMKMQDWNSFSKSEYQLQAIHLPNHPEHNHFINAFNEVWFESNVYHNLYEFIKINKKIL